MDSLLDEYLGRWPIRTRKIKSQIEPPEGDPADEKKANEEDERILDEVKHQGVLDKLAVKAAIIKKRIAHMPGNDQYHQALEDVIASLLLKNCEPHLSHVVLSWFKKNSKERA